MSRNTRNPHDKQLWIDGDAYSLLQSQARQSGESLHKFVNRLLLGALNKGVNEYVDPDTNQAVCK